MSKKNKFTPKTTDWKFIEKVINGNNIPLQIEILKSDIVTVNILNYFASKGGKLDWRLAKAIAENPKTNLKILKKLAETEDFLGFVAANNLTTTDILSKLLKRVGVYGDLSVRRAIASHPNVSQDDILTLASAEDVEVRERIANNPNTPIEIIKIMYNDTDEDVKIAARKRIELN